MADLQRLVIFRAHHEVEPRFVCWTFLDVMDYLAFELVKLSLQSVAIFLLKLELFFLICENHSLEVS